MKFFYSDTAIKYSLLFFGEFEEPYTEEYDSYEDVMEAYHNQLEEEVISLPCFVQSLRYALSDCENDTMTVMTWVREHV